MTVAYLSPSPVFQGITANGAPLVGGLLYSYAAGTVTPISTWVDNTGVTPNTNPVQLNAFGQASVWLLPNVGYKFVLTDSAGNTQYTQDQIFNTTQALWGGVDTGVVNAYVVNFNAPFAALQHGIIVYWVPGNTNTGPSTLNVNGLGVAAILNQNGMALGPGQIVAGGITAVVYYNGNWLLTSSTGSIPQTGSFIGTLSSGPNTFPMPCKYAINGNVCILTFGFGSVLNSGGTLAMTGLPTLLQPATTSSIYPVPIAVNNVATIGTALAQIGSTSTIQFWVSASGGAGGWTNGATCGIGVHIGLFNFTSTIVYSLA